MSGTKNIDEMALWYALFRLETKHWRDVDFNGGRSTHELYCENAVFTVGPNRFDGRHGIQTFYEWRRSRGEMTSRHVISNMVVHAHHERNATAFGLITIYRAKGGHPLEQGNVPSLVADFESECVIGDDDVWRYVAHILDPVFIGPNVPLSLAIDPRFLTRVDERVG